MAISKPISISTSLKSNWISQQFSLGESDKPLLAELCELYVSRFVKTRNPSGMESTISCILANLIVTRRLSTTQYVGLYRDKSNSSFYDNFKLVKWNLKVCQNFLDLLEEMGAIEGNRGYVQWGRSLSSIYRLSLEKEELANRIKACKPEVKRKGAEYVVLRPKKVKGETPRDRASKTKVFNNLQIKFKKQFKEHKMLADDLFDLMHKASITNKQGEELTANHLCWIYTENFDNHGRMYFNLQNMPSKDRKFIKINGEETVEIDYNNCSAHIMYAKNGHQLEGDAYPTSTEFTRKVSKKCFTVMCNVSSRHHAIQAVYNDLKMDGGNKSTPSSTRAAVAKANTYLKKSIRLAVVALEEMHHLLMDAEEFGFYQKNGGQVMKIDSTFAMRVVQDFVDRGEVIIPIHDSFIVRKSLTDELRPVMIQSYQSVLGADYTIGLTQE